MDSSWSSARIALTRRDTRRLTLVLVVSAALHILALSSLSLRPSAWRVADAPPLQIVLEPAAPSTAAPAPPKPPVAPKAGSERAPPPAPRLDLGLDNPLRPTPRPGLRDEGRRPIASAHGGSSGPAGAIETRYGTIETYKVGDGQTTVRYVFNDGRVRCFFIRDPDVNNSFDAGAVLAGRRC